MILEQIYLDCLAQASYFIADPNAGVAAVVDPRRDIDVYLDLAAEHGVEIRHALLTHFHADFVSGHIELHERTGARIGIGAGAHAEFGHDALEDGREILLGDIRIQVLATPGHTPESVSFLVFDGVDAETPHAVLTGDTLFIGDVGRPDLMASVGTSAAELASALYDSTRRRLLPLPDATLVYPGHGAGSMCGKNLSSETVSTIGDQRRTNASLQPMTREEFVERVSAGQPKTPRYFAADAKINRQRRQTLGQVLAEAVRPLALDDIISLQAGSTVVLDCRPAAEFAERHLAGSVWVGLDGKFATWAGTVLDPDCDVVLIATDADRAAEAAMRLGRIGHDRILGCLCTGVCPTWLDRADLARTAERRSTAALRDALDGEDAPLVIDLRTPGEWESGHIPGALHIPLIDLQERRGAIPHDRPVALVCGSGYRSLIASSLLETTHDDHTMFDIVGGMTAWNRKPETQQAQQP